MRKIRMTKILQTTKGSAAKLHILAGLMLCALCISLQTQPIYAAGDAVLEENNLQASSEGSTGEEPSAEPDGAQTGEPGENSDDPAESDEPQEPGDSEEPDEPQEPGDSGEPDEAQESGALPVPKKVSGLRTTRQSDKKVVLAWYGSDDAASYRVYRRIGNGSYKKLGEVTAEHYTDKTIVFGKTYRYRVVPVNADGVEGEAAAITFSHTQAVNITVQKYSFKQMEADMKELAKAYSDYCEIIPIGTSVEGRTIYDFAIGNPDAKKSLLVVSTLHAREYICSVVLMREIEYYLSNYNQKISGTTPAEALENMQIHYIVMANPDGVTISQTTYARWKANSRGVDLNRNFPAKKFVVGGKKGAEGYSGKKALSEPESKAIAAFTQNLKKNQNLVGVVNYHAMGQIVFGDCSAKKIKKATTTMYQIARELTGYRDAGGYGSKTASSGGQYREYVMDLLELPSITIEIGYTSAPCSFWEYESAFRKNKLVVLKIAEAL